MAITDSKKVDYLWKKLGYGKAKTDTNAQKKAPNEAIDSPLLMRGDVIWAQAHEIPSTIPGSTTTHVRIYSGTTAVETTEDNTSTANRTWKTGQTDWIPTQFGSTYLVKVYSDTSGVSDATSTGTQLFPTGSGNDDEWFFDYEAGILHFIGTNLPSSIDGSKVVYITGARYIGTKGITSANNFITVGAKIVQANTISMANTTSPKSLTVSGANSTVKSANVVIQKVATINELRLGNHINNGVLIGRTFNKRIGFETGTSGEIFQVAANGTPSFAGVNGGNFTGS